MNDTQIDISDLEIYGENMQSSNVVEQYEVPTINNVVSQSKPFIIPYRVQTIAPRPLPMQPLNINTRPQPTFREKAGNFVADLQNSVANAQNFFGSNQQRFKQNAKETNRVMSSGLKALRPSRKKRK